MDEKTTDWRKRPRKPAHEKGVKQGVYLPRDVYERLLVIGPSLSAAIATAVRAFDLDRQPRQ